MTDDTIAINNFINTWKTTQRSAYVPKGVYRYIGRFLVDMSTVPGKTLAPIFGDGPYLSKFVVETSIAPAISFYASTLFDHYFLIMHDIGFNADNVVISMALGLSNFTDCPCNYNFKNVFVGNANAGNLNATVMQLNFVYSSTFTNCVFVGKPGYGIALELRRAQFNILAKIDFVITCAL